MLLKVCSCNGGSAAPEPTAYGQALNRGIAYPKSEYWQMPRPAFGLVAAQGQGGVYIAPTLQFNPLKGFYYPGTYPTDELPRLQEIPGWARFWK